jgi:hypothetical protein
MTHQCDVCGRHCSRIHQGMAYGMDTSACDDCWGYEWEAYDEEPDPVLHPEPPARPYWDRPEGGGPDDELPF